MLLPKSIFVKTFALKSCERSLEEQFCLLSFKDEIGFDLLASGPFQFTFEVAQSDGVLSDDIDVDYNALNNDCYQDIAHSVPGQRIQGKLCETHQAIDQKQDHKAIVYFQPIWRQICQWLDQSQKHHYRNSWQHK